MILIMLRITTKNINKEIEDLSNAINQLYVTETSITHCTQQQQNVYSFQVQVEQSPGQDIKQVSVN